PLPKSEPSMPPSPPRPSLPESVVGAADLSNWSRNPLRLMVRCPEGDARILPVQMETGRQSPSRFDVQLSVAGNQAAASLSFFSGRTLTFTEAGLAANHCSSLVNGLMPLRLGLAGTLTALNLATPGRAKLPVPFLLSEPWIAPSSAPSTARMSFAARLVASAMCATRPDLVRASLIALGAVDLAAGLAAFFGAAAFLVGAFFFAMGLCSLVSVLCGLRSVLAERAGRRNVGHPQRPANRKPRKNCGQRALASAPAGLSCGPTRRWPAPPAGQDDRGEDRIGQHEHPPGRLEEDQSREPVL